MNGTSGFLRSQTASKRSANTRRVLGGGVVLTLLLLWLTPSFAAPPAGGGADATRNGEIGYTDPATTADPASPSDVPASEEEPPPTPASVYGAWGFMPPLITIVLAIWWRQVIPALAFGVLVAAYMLVFIDPPDTAVAVVFGGIVMAVDEFLIGALRSESHLKIITFTLLIGGIVGVIAANGGTRAVVHGVASWASNRKRGQIATWFAGLLVFFDDYANAMIVGPSMQPIADRLKISRAKLAYLVDSTAAPVASVALVGTWVGAEVGFIDGGLQQLTERPEFLANMNAYQAFLASIPYRYYAWLALVMVFLIGFFNRDFGPMRRAEIELEPPTYSGATDESVMGSDRGRSWFAWAPIIVLVVGTMVLMGVTGYYGYHEALDKGELEDQPLSPVQLIVENADTHDSVLYASLAALVVAILISLTTRTLNLGQCMEAATQTMARMTSTLLVLVMAWTLSGAMRDLELGIVGQQLLEEMNFQPIWLPLLVFVMACVISFATGTSWGTMGILCPTVIVVAAALMDDMPPAEALPLFYAAVGAVLAGAVFGDHCSPISDTTVLSSIATGCALEKHVWTQIPYALTVAIVSMLSGEVLVRWANLPPWVGLGVGTAALILIVRLFGRKPPRAVPA